MTERFKKSKVLFYLLVLIIIVSLALVFRVTYAYLEDYVSDGASSDVSVNIKNSFVDFEPGGALVLDVTASTLANEGSDLVTTSNPKVNFYDMKEGNKRTYYTYLSIKTNTYTYTNPNQAELLLSIIGPNNEEIKTVTGLSYLSNQGLHGASGFDVTTYSNPGEPLLIKTSEIVSTGKEVTTDEWTFKLTYLNLDIDQSQNLGKEFDIQVIMQDHEMTPEEKAEYK